MKIENDKCWALCFSAACVLFLKVLFFKSKATAKRSRNLKGSCSTCTWGQFREWVLMDGKSWSLQFSRQLTLFFCTEISLIGELLFLLFSWPFFSGHHHFYGNLKAVSCYERHKTLTTINNQTRSNNLLNSLVIVLRQLTRISSRPSNNTDSFSNQTVGNRKPSIKRQMRLMGLNCNLLPVYLGRCQDFNSPSQTSSPTIVPFFWNKRTLSFSATFLKISGFAGVIWKVFWDVGSPGLLNSMKAIC